MQHPTTDRACGTAEIDGDPALHHPLSYVPLDRADDDVDVDLVAIAAEMTNASSILLVQPQQAMLMTVSDMQMTETASAAVTGYRPRSTV